MKQKVFGLGFHKTGTSSLASALHALGHNVCGQQNALHKDLINGNINIFTTLAKNYDAFEDDPWYLLYKELDEAFPNSKFILTDRDVDSWYNSCLNHFFEDTTPIRDYIYGDGRPKGNEENFKRIYLKHQTDVINYFKNRPNDFLIINFTKGEGWEKLCPFLGVEIPNKPIPHANKGLYTKKPNGLKKKLWLYYKKLYAFLYHNIYRPLFK
ncbi:MAG: hypothetical protein H6587_12690 [Flavobacteriales bacterium]|nr:hypothetical protein [Flavobacteriales bacterium]MCB9365421.1 hypothetical protein [Flavobacteriales bacterium]